MTEWKVSLATDKQFHNKFQRRIGYDLLTDIWQQITRQVCECKHTKRHHIKLREPFNDRSDVQCHDWVFNGGAYGEHGTLGCCQCLSYNKKRESIYHVFWQLKQIVSPDPEREHPKPKTFFCVCGHNAVDHGIGTNYNILYPPCTKCKCPQYDYVNNPVKCHYQKD